MVWKERQRPNFIELKTKAKPGYDRNSLKDGFSVYDTKFGVPNEEVTHRLAGGKDENLGKSRLLF